MESSIYFVSNAHILDALVGTAPRERRFFMEGLHWVRHGKRRPMLLDHPVGSLNRKLHAMWNPRSSAKGVRVSHNIIFISFEKQSPEFLPNVLLPTRFHQISIYANKVNLPCRIHLMSEKITMIVPPYIDLSSSYSDWEFRDVGTFGCFCRNV